MLCRACGEEMIAFKYCSDCNEVIQSRCGTCNKEDEMSIHYHNQHTKNLNSFSLGQCVLIISNFAILLNLV